MKRLSLFHPGLRLWGKLLSKWRKSAGRPARQRLMAKRLLSLGRVAGLRVAALSGMVLPCTPVVAQVNFSDTFSSPFIHSQLKPGLPAYGDLDGDGDFDLLLGSENPTVARVINTGNANSPIFSNNANLLGLTTSNNDPCLADMDNDGDLDILLGGSLGHLTYFPNIGSPSSYVSGVSSMNPFGFQTLGQRSSFSLADLDGDGDLDLMSGSLVSGLILRRNMGTPTSASFQLGFTFGEIPGGKCSPELADLDNDGDYDLLVGVSNTNRTSGIYFSENGGTPTSYSFGPWQPAPFGLDTVPQEPRPRLVDMDGDGDLDLYLGNVSGTQFYRNVGTVSEPIFSNEQPETPFNLPFFGEISTPTLADLDADGDLDMMVFADNRVVGLRNEGQGVFAPAASFNFPSFGQYGRPTFADIDGDGDLDGFMGQYDGRFAFYENQGDGASPSFANSQDNPFGLPDVGNYSSPVFEDFDADGDLDLYTTSFKGQNYWVPNVGDWSNPSFGSWDANPFGLGNVDYFASPAFVDVDQDGDLDLFMGQNTGVIRYNANVGSPGAPSFGTFIDYPLYNVGPRATPVVGDLDLDGKTDMLVGSLGGMIYFFPGLTDMSPPWLARVERHFPNQPIALSDSLVFRLLFSEPVVGVSADDFLPLGTTAAIALEQLSSSELLVSLSGGDLSTIMGPVGIELISAHGITDTSGLAMKSPRPLLSQRFMKIGNNVWSDGQWSGGEPVFETPIIIRDAFDTQTNGAFDCQTLEVIDGGRLLIRGATIRVVGQ